MDFIKNKSFTWERKCKVLEIPIRELELLCKQYNINSPTIKIIINESKESDTNTSFPNCENIKKKGRSKKIN